MKKDEKYLKKAVKSVRDFAVKLSKVYKKDFYILDGTYLYPGIQSEADLPGKLICEIEEPYKEYLSELGIVNSSLVYISDVKTFKDDTITPKTIIENETKINEIKKEVYSFVDNVKKETDTWNKFEVDTDLFFDEKEIIEVQSHKDDIPSVILGIKMIPLISEKNINDIYYVCNNEKTELSLPVYYIIIDFHTPHFRIFMKYNYVSPVV